METIVIDRYGARLVIDHHKGKQPCLIQCQRSPITYKNNMLGNNSFYMVKSVIESIIDTSYARHENPKMTNDERRRKYREIMEDTVRFQGLGDYSQIFNYNYESTLECMLSNLVSVLSKSEQFKTSEI